MYRALATANAFAANGWRVTVLTTTRSTFERMTNSDPRSERLIDPAITVIRLPFESPRGEPDLGKWSRTRVFSPLLWSSLISLRESITFPEPVYGVWAKTLRRAAETVHAANPVSLVIGTANPNVDFLPGHRLNQKYGVPYVMDYRDTWHLDMYSGKRIGLRHGRSARIERRLLTRAEEVWFVNAAIRDWHLAEYPPSTNKYHVVMNGFDDTVLSEKRPARSDVHERGLVFGYLGSVYGPMPLREALEGWRLARAQSPTIARSTFSIRGYLGRASAPDMATLQLIQEFEADGVSYGGPVSKTDVATTYSGFDALVLILGKSKYATSGKVFEYAATGLPIASLNDATTASSMILEDYPALHLSPSLSAHDIAATFAQTAEHAIGMSVDDITVVRAWADHLSRIRQLSPRIDALSQATNRPIP